VKREFHPNFANAIPRNDFSNDFGEFGGNRLVAHKKVIGFYKIYNRFIFGQTHMETPLTVLTMIPSGLAFVTAEELAVPDRLTLCPACAGYGLRNENEKIVVCSNCEGTGRM
jgi:DnaJ-class molecular chaperone